MQQKQIIVLLAILSIGLSGFSAFYSLKNLPKE
jgi:hypothetical protein